MAEPILLAGLHDREGAPHVPAGGWCVDTVALADKPLGTDYPALASGVNWIGRLNWGYGTTGTIPRPHEHGEMATRAAWYVSESTGCKRWIIGNETNHAQERAGGVLITPGEYARAFVLCRQAIKRVQPDAEVIPAPVAVWNVQSGDWLDYSLMVLTAIGRGGFDALALHSYIHRADPALVNSALKMPPPYQDRYFEFRAYEDVLARVPAWARHLPVYMTEANPLDGWQAVGIIPAMLENVTRWNDQADTQKIHSVVFYRYPPYDEGARWAMSTKPDVMAEFAEHAPRYPAPVPNWPAIAADSEPRPEAGAPRAPTPVYVPTASAGATPQPEAPPRDIDERLRARGVGIQPAKVEPGQAYWRLVRAVWMDEQEAGGRYHIYVDALSEDGKRLAGVAFEVTWPSGNDYILTEEKPGEPWAANHPMSPSRNEFSIRPANDPGDAVNGIGMGADTPDGFNPGAHTATGLVYQWTRASKSEAAPQPTPPQPQATVPQLVHPVQNPAHRRVTQPFGVNRERYAQFGLDGHNGIDFAVPAREAICAVAHGVPVEVADDPLGYGLYVKVKHPWGETLYAHLSQHLCDVGKPLSPGETLGLSGNTGNSTGPHLHFGLRINPYRRGRPFDGYSDPAPYLQATGEIPQSTGDVRHILREAAREFGIDEELILSQAWAESSFNPNARSAAGALGLMQIMPQTWDEWSAKVGAQDPLNARDSARVGAAYMQWLIQTLAQTYDQNATLMALIAYGWGIGNLLAGEQEPPQLWKTYAAKIVHGRDLLKAVQA